MAGAAAEEEIIQLPVAGLKRVFVAELRAELEEWAAGVVEEDAVGESRRVSAGRLDAVEKRHVQILGLVELIPVIGAGVPALKLAAPAVERTPIFAQAKESLAGGQPLEALELESSRSPSTLPGVAITGIKFGVIVLHQVEPALVLEVHLERVFGDHDVKLRRLNQISAALVGEAGGERRPQARLFGNHRLLFAPEAAEVIADANHVRCYRGHRRRPARVEGEGGRGISVRAVHGKRDVGDRADGLDRGAGGQGVAKVEGEEGRDEKTRT